MAASESNDLAKEAAINASANAPKRHKRKPTKDSKSNILVSWHHMPEYLRDNEYILRYYRREQRFRDSWKTLFQLHNETGNVWTHLLGFLAFVGLMIYFFYSPPAPLAFGHQQVDSLWSSMQHQLSSLSGKMHHLQDSIHTLQDSINSGVHVLQDSLQDSISSGVHVLADSMHVLQDSLQDTISSGVHVLQDSVHAIHDQVSDKAQLLKHNLFHLQDNVHHLREHLNQQLHNIMSPVLQYPTTRWPVYVYFVGAMICLLTSSLCHLLGCCSQHKSQWLWRLDYSGISVLLVASFFPPVYYGFLCEPFWRNFYLGTTSLFGLTVLVASLAPKFQQPKYRPIRAALFAGFGLYGVFPIAHQYLLHNDIYHVRVSLALDVLMGAIYLGGAAVYALRVPERWWPGTFDLLFNSHQIFHVAVVSAALVHLYAIYVLVEWRDASGGCAVPRGLSGPLGEVLQEFQAQGLDLLSIEQVWELLRSQLHAHNGVEGLAQGVAAPAPAGL